MLCIGVWVTNNLRHGGFGRMLQALRDNEHAARAFTVPNRMRMIQLYAVSGALAGLGGIVIGHGQSQLTVNSFPADASIDVVAVTVDRWPHRHPRPAHRRAADRRSARPSSAWAWSARPRSPSAGCSW